VSKSAVVVSVLALGLSGYTAWVTGVFCGSCARPTAEPDEVAALTGRIRALEERLAGGRVPGGEKDAFRCSVPADWRQTRDEHDDERTHTFGVLLSGPMGAEGISPTVSVRFYGPGNPTAETADAFINRQTRPSLVAPRDEETSKVSDAVVAGLKARTFARKTSEFLNPDTLDAKAVPVRQEVFVVPGPKGYFVLRFSAPVGSFDKWKPVFQEVRDSFKPNTP
jgi:hypothetical protein